MNLFTSNSKTLLLGIALFAGSQFIFLSTSNIAQTASKQIVQEKRNWAKKKGIITAAPNKDLIFFFGNSRMSAGIIPDIFDASNNNASTSYNLSLIGLQLPVHYFLLKDYLRHNVPPKYILLNPLSKGYDIESFPSYAVQGAGLEEIIPYAFYRKNMDIFFNFILPARLHWPETVRYFTGKILTLMPPGIRELHKKLYLERFGNKEIWGHNRPYFYESQFLRPEELHKNRIELLKKQRGYYYAIEESTIGGQVTEQFLTNVGIELLDCPARLNEQNNNEQNEKTPSKEDFDALIDPLTRKFFRLTQEKGITVVLLPTYYMGRYPLGCIATTGTPPRQPSPLYKYLQATYNNIYVLPDSGEIEYPFTLFSDPSHLNPEGAKMYTQRIAESFKQLRLK